MSWLPTRHMSCVSTIIYAQCSEPMQRRRPSAACLHKGGELRPPPFVFSFALALNTGHILLLRRKTCALLRAKTSAFLRRRTRAVLRAWTCAFFRANAKEAAFGRLHKGGRPSAAPLCGFLCIGSKQSTCPSSPHSTCPASQQGRCIASQQGTCLASQQ